MLKVLIQTVEVGIWLTIALFLWNELLKLLNLWILDIFNPIFNTFVYLFWYNVVSIFVKILTWIFIVMAWRWIMSWASNNWWQTPNNNWN